MLISLGGGVGEGRVMGGLEATGPGRRGKLYILYNNNIMLMPRTGQEAKLWFGIE